MRPGCAGLAQGAAVGDLGPWEVAAVAAEKARDLLEPGVEPALRKQVEDLAAELAVERQQAEAAARGSRNATGPCSTGSSTSAAPRPTTGAASAPTQPMPTPSATRGWTWRHCPRTRRQGESGPGRPPWRRPWRPRWTTGPPSGAIGGRTVPARRRSSALARAADPDEWRNRLRTALDQPDAAARRTALQGLAGGASYETLGPVSLDLLGRALNNAADPAGAESVLRRAQQRHPGDVWINYDLAVALEKLARRDEAIRYYTAARSLRPETAHELAHALQAKGEKEEAIGVFEDLRRLRPGNGRHLGCLGRALKNQGRSQEAGAILEAAAAANREAVRLRPDDAYAHFSLGFALDEQGKLDEAIAEYRTAIRIQPDYANAHDTSARPSSGRGNWMRRSSNSAPPSASIPTTPTPTPIWALACTGRASWMRRSPSTAPLSESSPTTSRPTTASAGPSSGRASWMRRSPSTAPTSASSPITTGVTTASPGHWPSPLDRSSRERSEALEHARQAVALSPKEGTFHNTLALAEYRVGHWAESIAAAERSIALLKGVDASNWFFLAMALWQRGEKDRSRSYFDQAVAWTKKNDPKNAELLAFWREAAELLGQPGPSAAAPLPDLPASPFVP